MDSYRYRINKSTLHGQVKVSGAKNSVLRLLAASLLTSEPLVVSNYPMNLLDAQVHLEMLEVLGKSCCVEPDCVTITEESGVSSDLDWTKRSIRNTLLILGALTARTGQARVPLPGGCKLGERKYDLHVMILEKMGARVFEEGEYLCTETSRRLQGADIHLPIRSTGATENAILCGSLAEGKTTIWNPHIRPEIFDLIDMLNKMGAKIKVYGQERIEVMGQENLNGVKHRVISDNMEALTWLIGAVMTDGDVEIHGFPYQHLEVPLTFLRESGAQFYQKDDQFIVRGGVCYPIEISTGPYPGINSDMQPLFAAYGACAKGESRIIDLRFIGRYDYSEEFHHLGISTEVQSNMLNIYGGNQLVGATVRALDLRAGAALSLLGLVTEGETTLTDAWQVERGYNDFVSKLKALGAHIEVEGEM